MKNEELIKAILEIDKDHLVEGLNNAQLTDALKALKANDVTAEVEGAELDEPKRKPGLYVCAGKSVTSLKGLLEEGTKVEESYFNSGSESIKRLVKIKVLEVVKK